MISFSPGSQTEENTNIKDLDNDIIELDTDDSNDSYTTITSDEINEPSEEKSAQKVYFNISSIYSKVIL